MAKTKAAKLQNIVRRDGRSPSFRKRVDGKNREVSLGLEPDASFQKVEHVQRAISWLLERKQESLHQLFWENAISIEQVVEAFDEGTVDSLVRIQDTISGALVTWEDAVQAWRRKMRVQNRAPGSMQTYESGLRCLAVYLPTETPLLDIGYHTVEGIIEEILEDDSRGSGANTMVNRVFLWGAVHDAGLRLLQDKKMYHPPNPWRQLNLKGERARARVYTGDEIRAIRAELQKTGGIIEGWWYLTLCGLRRSEALRLPRSHISETGDRLKISLKEYGSRSDRIHWLVGSKAKTPNAVRSFLAPEPYGTWIREWLKKNPGDFPFFHDDSSVGKRFKEACKRAGVKHGKPDGIFPHTGRHTLATHLLEDGIPIDQVANLLGDKPATIRNTYAHVISFPEAVDVDTAVANLLDGRPDV